MKGKHFIFAAALAITAFGVSAFAQDGAPAAPKTEITTVKYAKQDIPAIKYGNKTVYFTLDYWNRVAPTGSAVQVHADKKRIFRFNFSGGIGKSWGDPFSSRIPGELVTTSVSADGKELTVKIPYKNNDKIEQFTYVVRIVEEGVLEIDWSADPRAKSAFTNQEMFGWQKSGLKINGKVVPDRDFEAVKAAPAKYGKVRSIELYPNDPKLAVTVLYPVTHWHNGTLTEKASIQKWGKDWRFGGQFGAYTEQKIRIDLRGTPAPDPAAKK